MIVDDLDVLEDELAARSAPVVLDPVRAVISEYALRHASPHQLRHINEMGRLPNVTVQLLSNSAPAHDGNFTVLEFPDLRYPKILYVEHVGGAVYYEDHARVQKARLSFRHLSKLALTPEESAAWIERTAAER